MICWAAAGVQKTLCRILETVGGYAVDCFDANSHFSDDSLRVDALGSMRPLQALAE